MGKATLRLVNGKRSGFLSLILKAAVITAVVILGIEAHGAGLSEGLTGRWNMDETAWHDGTNAEVADAGTLGNYGTFNGGSPTLPLGRKGRAGIFDGTDDYVDFGSVPDVEFSNSSSFTVSGWIYRKSNSDGGIIGCSSNWGGWSVLVDDNGNISMRLGDTTDRCSSSININQWHHFTFVRDIDNDLGYGTNKLVLFIDGVYQTNQDAGSLTLQYSNASLRVGGNITTGGGWYFDGLLDEVAVWNRALSTDEINIAASLDPIDGLVGYWMMDESIWHVGTPDEVYDSSGRKSDGTYYGEHVAGTGYYLPDGKLGKAGDFKKSNDIIRYVDCGTSVETQFTKDDPFTISGWIYREGNGDPYDGVICHSASWYGWSILTYYGSIKMRLGGTQNRCSYSINDDEWTHFVFVRDVDNDLGYGTNRLVLYINGQKVKDEDAGSDTLYYGSEKLILGSGASQGMSNWGFKGLIDEVAVWNRTLSDTEISDLYNSGEGKALLPYRVQTKDVYRASCLEYVTQSVKNGYTMKSGYYRKKFTLPSGQVWRAAAEIGDQVIVYVNGQKIEQKPETIRKTCAGGCYDHVVVDLKPYLNAGQTNVVAFYSERATYNPISFFQGKVVMDGGVETVLDTVTSNGWKAYGSEQQDWTTVAYDDSAWTSANIIDNPSGFSGYFKVKERMPVYDGRLLLIKDTNNTPLFFDKANPVELKVKVPGNWSIGTAKVNWTLRRAEKNGLETKIGSGSQSSSTVIGTSRFFSLNLGSQQRGVYTLEVNLESGGQILESRLREPFVVTGQIPMNAIEGTSFEDGLTINLEDTIDFTDSSDSHSSTETIWEDKDANNYDIITEVNDPIIIDKGTVKYRETRLGENMMYSYDFEFKHPGDWYLMVLEYPNDRRYATGVSISRDKQNGHLTESGPGVMTGRKYPLSNELRELKWIHRADEGPHTVDIISLDPNFSAAAAKLYIYHISGNLPELNVSSNGKRSIGMLSERAKYTGINFGEYLPDQEGHSYPDGFDMIQLWTEKLLWNLDVSEHYTQYLKFTGQNMHVMGAFQYDDKNLSYEPPDRVETGRILRDIRDIALRVFESNGISMISTIEYSNHLSMLEGSSYCVAGDKYMPKDYSGESPTGSVITTSIGHSDVQNALLYVIDDLAYRFSGSSAWKGVYLMAYPGTLGPAFYSEDDPYAWDYSDAAIAAYESDSGDTVPGTDGDPDRFLDRYNYLTGGTKKAAWTSWRCNEIHDLTLAARNKLHTYRNDLECMFGFYLSSLIIKNWVDSEEDYTDYMAQYSLDPSLYLSDDNIWPVRYMYPEGTTRAAIYPYPQVWEQHVGQQAIAAYGRATNRSVMLHSGWYEMERSFSNGDFQQRTIMSQAPGQYSQEAFAQALIGSDPEIVMYGFTDIGFMVGNEQELRKFAKMYTALPKDKFNTVQSTTFTSNVVIRDITKDGKYWFYVVNPGYWTSQATINISGASSLFDIGAGQTVTVTAGEIVVNLPPYGVAAFRDDSGNGQVTGYSISSLSATDLSHMEELISLTKDTYPLVSELFNFTQEEESYINTTATQAQTYITAGQYAAAWHTLTNWKYWTLVPERIGKEVAVINHGDVTASTHKLTMENLEWNALTILTGEEIKISGRDNSGSTNFSFNSEDRDSVPVPTKIDYGNMTETYWGGSLNGNIPYSQEMTVSASSVIWEITYEAPEDTYAYPGELGWFSHSLVSEDDTAFWGTDATIKYQDNTYQAIRLPAYDSSADTYWSISYDNVEWIEFHNEDGTIRLEASSLETDTDYYRGMVVTARRDIIAGQPNYKWIFSWYGTVPEEQGYVEEGYSNTVTLTMSFVDEANTAIPTDFSPLCAYATERLEGCPSGVAIMKVRRDDNAEFDIYDILPGTSQYKTSSGGNWIDGSSNTFYVKTWYDQSGYGRDVSQSTNSYQPKLVFNAQNGMAMVEGDGVDDYLKRAYDSSLDSPTELTIVAGIAMQSLNTNYSQRHVSGNTWRLFSYKDIGTTWRIDQLEGGGAEYLQNMPVLGVNDSTVLTAEFSGLTEAMQVCYGRQRESYQELDPGSEIAYNSYLSLFASTSGGEPVNSRMSHVYLYPVKLNEEERIKAIDYITGKLGIGAPYLPQALCAYATERSTGCPANVALMKVRRDDNVEFDIYDILPGTSQYKTSATGSWTDGSANTFYVKTWYDQSGSGKDVSQATSSYQPKLVFNAQNGMAMVESDGVDDYLLRYDSNLDSPEELTILADITMQSLNADYSQRHISGSNWQLYSYKDIDTSWSIDQLEGGGSECIQSMPVLGVDDPTVLAADFSSLDETMQVCYNHEQEGNLALSSNSEIAYNAYLSLFASTTGSEPVNSRMSHVYLYPAKLDEKKSARAADYIMGKLGLGVPYTSQTLCAYATERLAGCPDNVAIMKVRRNDSVELDIYDIKRGTSQYKTSATGSWIDGSANTFYVKTWYDQSGSGKDVSQSTSSYQPKLIFNAQNGMAMVEGDGVDDYLLRSDSNLNSPEELTIVADISMQSVNPAKSQRHVSSNTWRLYSYKDQGTVWRIDQLEGGGSKYIQNMPVLGVNNLTVLTAEFSSSAEIMEVLYNHERQGSKALDTGNEIAYNAYLSLFASTTGGEAVNSRMSHVFIYPAKLSEEKRLRTVNYILETLNIDIH